ncbi:MAG: hypothetical protein ABIQ01_12160 [Pseudolysinimonas sp.]
MTTTPIPTGPTPTGAAGPSKLLIALIAVGGVLLLAVVAIAFLLIGQNSNNGNQETVGDTTTTPPTASPSVAPTEAASEGDGDEGSDGDDGGQAVDNSVRFTNFNYNAQVSCDPTGNDEKPSPSISWASANAVHVYWTPNSNDANAENGYEVGASGNQDDMSQSKGPGERYEFPCNHRETFDTTITLVGANGSTVSKHVTFTDINWNSGGSDDDE